MPNGRGRTRRRRRRPPTPPPPRRRRGRSSSAELRRARVGAGTLGRSARRGADQIMCGACSSSQLKLQRDERRHKPIQIIEQSLPWMIVGRGKGKQRDMESAAALHAELGSVVRPHVSRVGGGHRHLLSGAARRRGRRPAAAAEAGGALALRRRPEKAPRACALRARRTRSAPASPAAHVATRRCRTARPVAGQLASPLPCDRERRGGRKDPSEVTVPSPRLELSGAFDAPQHRADRAARRHRRPHVVPPARGGARREDDPCVIVTHLVALPPHLRFHRLPSPLENRLLLGHPPRLALFLGRAHAGVLVGPPVPAVLVLHVLGHRRRPHEPVAVALTWPHFRRVAADASDALEVVLDGVSAREAHEVVAAVAARAAGTTASTAAASAAARSAAARSAARSVESRRFEKLKRFGDSGGRCPSLTTKRRGLLGCDCCCCCCCCAAAARRRRRCVRRGGSSVISRELGGVDREIGERDDGARRRQRRLGGGGGGEAGGGAARRHRDGRRHPGRQAGRQAGGRRRVLRRAPRRHAGRQIVAQAGRAAHVDAGAQLGLAAPTRTARRDRPCLARCISNEVWRPRHRRRPRRAVGWLTLRRGTAAAPSAEFADHEEDWRSVAPCGAGAAAAAAGRRALRARGPAPAAGGGRPGGRRCSRRCARTPIESGD